MTPWHRGWILALCVGWSAPALAQPDMIFTSEVQGPASPASQVAPSETLASGLRMYAQHRYLEAAVHLQRVIEGRSRDAPSNLQRAEFFLAKALFHLHFYRGALSLFNEIVDQGASHLFFGETLPWLAQLALELPAPAGIVELVGRYPVPMIEALNTAENRNVYDRLQYLAGRHAYDSGDVEDAIQHFNAVHSNSEQHVQARFFLGVSHVRRRRARPAIEAFRAVIGALQEGTTTAEPERMRDLAWMSLARVYYTAANRTDPETGDESIDPELLQNAIAAWERVPMSSEYWLDSMFEQSWAYFLVEDYPRAMGNIHTLFSPYFDDAYYPEALVIKAVVFFAACQEENTEAMIGQFHDRYDPVRAELEATLEPLQDNNAFFEFLQRVRAGRAELPPRIRGIVSSALADRTLLRHLEYVRQLEAEEARLGQWPQEVQQGSLADRIRADIAVARSFAIDRTGDLARGRYRRLLDELDELMSQIDTVEVELIQAVQDRITDQGRVEQELRPTQRFDVVVDEEHQRWPFDGEYWRDELPFYRQQVTRQCGR